MKKIYLQPTMKLVNSTMSLIIATSYNGDATEYHGGGASGKEDNENEKPVGGTGDDSGFELGSKRRGNIFYD